ncbi:uncharacterized protein LOC117178661 [Belonocnema kinseyi]|uniref:uncharacterized protein LOC117178661 n=1 Tax=Belonocnema kinseyi TaxID=2817044 RepID=UPI00143DA3F5|nr:uncharacterized protein LOC117178661 [Belonocnema kinseyi]
MLTDAIKGMEFHAKDRRNLDKEIKDGIKLALKALNGFSQSLLQTGLELPNPVDAIPSTSDRVSVSQKPLVDQSSAERTPVSNTKRKRPATNTPSPSSEEMLRPTKKPQVSGATQEWVDVPKKKKKRDRKAQADTAEAGKRDSRRKKRRRTRPEAVIIQPVVGRSYAEVVTDIKKSVNPEDMGVEIKAIRKTLQGGVLLEFGKTTTAQKKSEFSEALRGVIKETGVVRQLAPRTQIQIFDLDIATTVDEVQTALHTALKRETRDDFIINMTKKDTRGSLMAFVQMKVSDAKELLQQGHVKVGWVRCRIREKVRAVRCFRCFDYGHTAAECKGADRSKLCWKCGTENHQAKSCTKEPTCVLFTERGGSCTVDHIIGSAKCVVYREADRKCNQSRR